MPDILTNLLYILGAVVAFGACIFVHELGHYLAARWRGLVAERFSIGFGPKLIGWKDKNGCTWQISPIPLGGYVLLPQLADMKGIEGESDLAKQKVLPPISYTDKMIVSAAGAFFNMIFAVVLATILWGLGTEVSRPSASTQVGYIGQVPVVQEGKIVGQDWPTDLRLGDTIVAIDGIMVDDMNDIMRIVATSSNRGSDGRQQVRATVVRDGQTLDLTLYPVSLNPELTKLPNLPIEGAYDLIVSDTSPNSPGAKAGLQTGDIVRSVDGQKLYSLDQLVDYLQLTVGQDSTYEVERAGETLSVQMRPEVVVYDTAGNANAKLGINFGKSFESVIIHEDPITQLRDAAGLIFRIIGALFNPRSQVGLGEMSSVVGISHALYTAFEAGIRTVLTLLITINVNLGILNLLPIPVLDGGHMAFATIGKLMGRPLPLRFVSALQGSFMVLLIGLMLYVTFFDVRRTGKINEMVGTNEARRNEYIQPVFDGVDAVPAQAPTTEG